MTKSILPKRILVTGSSGFVGKHLCAHLRQSGVYEVIAVPHQNLQNVLVDLAPVDHVVHLAAKIGVAESWHQPYAYYAANSLLTVAVLEYCRKHQCGLTFLSSFVYDKPVVLPIAETHSTAAQNPYAHSKLLAEEACRFYFKKFGVSSVIIRPGNIYGPGQSEIFLIPILLRQLRDPETTCIEVHDPAARRDFVYVADVVACIEKTIGFQGHETINAASGASISVAEVVDSLISATGHRKSLHVTQPRKPEEVADVRLDSGKALDIFGWRATTDFHKGIQTLCAN